MSSSSSYSSSSPPSSPNQTNTHHSKYERLNSDTLLETVKLKPKSLLSKNGGGANTTDECELDDQNSSADDTATTKTTLTTASTANHASSNESMCQSTDEYLGNGFKTTNSININNMRSNNNNNNNHHSSNDDNLSDLLVARLKNSEDIEATYMTSVSKNLITLRKTESLKLDSVQSIR